MVTYSQLVDRIIADAARGDTSITDTVKLHVLDAIEHYSTQRFWFNEATAAITTSSSDNLYSAPADFLELDSATVTINGAKRQLVPIGHKEMDAMDSGLVFGDPVYIAHFAEQFRLYPVPNRTVTISLSYQKYSATLSATGDSNAWTTVAVDLIRARAEKTFYAYKVRDMDSAQAMGLLEQEALKALENRTQKETSTGRIRGYW